ncbi:MAG: VWA domain-containing protein, partial [Terriglobales bacterium]
MGFGSKWLLNLAVFALAPGCVLGQTASFHTSVSRVLVPVTVTSHQGRAITGLGVRDFQIFVDGRRVPVRSVDWISAAAAGSTATEAAAGRPSSSAAGRPSSPGIFANARRPAPVSWVVLLVDFQNTQLDDMKWMREGVLRFLRHDLRAGQPVALYGVSKGLLLLQPFTYNRQRLIAAAERWIRPSLNWNLALPLPLAPDISKVSGGPGGINVRFARSRSAWEGNRSAARQSGVFTTAGALRQLAIRLAPLPGRKVVIWAGDGPPPLWLPQSGEIGQNLAPPVPDGAWRSRADTYELLNEADVELFPLDPRGIVLGMFDTSGRSRSPGTSPVTETEQQMSGWVSMEAAAQATGGRALVGNNLIWQLLEQAQREWSNYYLLSFQPPPDPPGKVRYHRIRVRVDRRGVTVSARGGYITRAPQVLAAEHPRPGFDMAAASPVSLPGIPLRVHWAPWRRQGKWR